MNLKKLAEAFRLAAEALEEDEDVGARETAAAPAIPRPRAHPAPRGTATSVDVARARKMLGRRGIGT